MSRYFIFLIIGMLVYDYIWWVDFWQNHSVIPEMWMIALNTMGILILMPFALQKHPESFLVKGALIWAGVFVVLKVISFQKFNSVIDNEAVTLISSILLNSCMVSPILFYSRKLNGYSSKKNPDT